MSKCGSPSSLSLMSKAGSILLVKIKKEIFLVRVIWGRVPNGKSVRDGLVPLSQRERVWIEIVHAW